SPPAPLTRPAARAPRRARGVRRRAGRPARPRDRRPSPGRRGRGARSQTRETQACRRSLRFQFERNTTKYNRARAPGRSRRAAGAALPPAHSEGRMQSFFASALDRGRRAAEVVLPIALLATRLVVGREFVETGIGKWRHFDRTAQFFASLGIPAPTAN